MLSKYLLRFINVPVFLFFSLVLHPLDAISQELKIVRKTMDYRLGVAADSSRLMVELKDKIPNLIYDLRYGGTDNFTGKKLYPQTEYTFLRLLPANALRNVQHDLAEMNLGLKVFDAYRPYSVTVRMWDLIKDERYVANPSKGSGHNRGLAIDLTLVNLKTGIELDMGTGFDNFTDTAGIDFKSLPDSILENRKILRQVMEKNGFKPLSTEWWHFFWPNDKGYEVLDLPFRKLIRKQ